MGMPYKALILISVQNGPQQMEGKGYLKEKGITQLIKREKTEI